MVGLVRTAVIGCGRFGGFHADKHAALPDAEFVAVADCDSAAAQALGARFGVRWVTDHRTLLGEVDAVSVTVPTRYHFAVARDFLDAGADVLVEKPIAGDPDEAQALVALAQARGRILQVGHLERFSAVARALKAHIDRPYFIDVIRAGPYHGRGTDVSVVVDLMIHDLDLVLWSAGAAIRDVTASGRRERSDHTDFAEARIRFDNGMVTRLVASRIHPCRDRHMRVFQPDGVLTADFETKQLTFMPAGESEPRQLAAPGAEDAVRAEIAAFLRCVASRQAPAVTGADGLAALEAAVAVERAIVSERAEIPGTAGRGRRTPVRCVS